MKKTSIILATLLLSGHGHASDQIDDYDFYHGVTTVPVNNQNLVLDDVSQRTASTDDTVLFSDDEGEINLTQADLKSLAKTVALIENYMKLASETLIDLKTKLVRVKNVFEPDVEVPVVEEVSPESDVEPVQVADEVVTVANQEVIPINIVQDDDVELFDDWDSDADSPSYLLEVVLDQVTPVGDEKSNEESGVSYSESEPDAALIEDTTFAMDDLGDWDSSTEEVTVAAPLVTRIIVAEGKVQRKYNSETDDSSALDEGYNTY